MDLWSRITGSLPTPSWMLHGNCKFGQIRASIWSQGSSLKFEMGMYMVACQILYSFFQHCAVIRHSNGHENFCTIGCWTLVIELCPFVRYCILKGPPKFTFLRFKLTQRSQVGLEGWNFVFGGSAIQTFEGLSEEATGLWLPALQGFSAVVSAKLKTFLGLTL